MWAHGDVQIQNYFLHLLTSKRGLSLCAAVRFWSVMLTLMTFLAQCGSKPHNFLFALHPSSLTCVPRLWKQIQSPVCPLQAGRMQWQFLGCSKPILAMLPACSISIADVFSCLCTLLATVVLFVPFDGVCGLSMTQWPCQINTECCFWALS